MSCNRQQLNITCGTDVVLHDRLIFEGETFAPNLSVGIAANLVSSLGKRTALDVQIVDDELLISVPWIDGTLPGCYGLEVTGSCNSKKWATYADSLIKYTKATRPGASEVTVESDSYDITQEVGFRYGECGNINDVKVNGVSVVSAGKANITMPTNVSQLANDSGYQTAQQVAKSIQDNLVPNAVVTVDDNTGTPSATVTKNGNTLNFDFKNLKGGKGDKGDDGGVGPTGPQGATGVYDSTTQDFLVTLETTTGDSQTKTMTQKAITDEIVIKSPIGNVSWAVGKGISPITGELVNNNNFDHSSYIDIEGYGMLNIPVTKLSMATGYAFYDAEKTYVSGGTYQASQAEQTSEYQYYLVNVPSNAMYIRLTAHSCNSTYWPGFYPTLYSVCNAKDNVDVVRKPIAGATWTNGYGVYASNGNTHSFGALAYCDYLDISAYEELFVPLMKTSYVYGVALYNQSKTFIEGASWQGAMGTTGDFAYARIRTNGAKYIRITAFSGFEYPTIYYAVPAIQELEEQMRKVDDLSSYTDDTQRLDAYASGERIYELNPIDGKGVKFDTGQIVNQADQAATTYIYLDGAKKIRIPKPLIGSGKYGIAFYTWVGYTSYIDGNVFSEYSTEEDYKVVEFDIPDNATYARFSIFSTSSPRYYTPWYQLIYGDNATWKDSAAAQLATHIMRSCKSISKGVLGDGVTTNCAFPAVMFIHDGYAYVEFGASNNVDADSPSPLSTSKLILTKISLETNEVDESNEMIAESLLDESGNAMTGKSPYAIWPYKNASGQVAIVGQITATGSKNPIVATSDFGAPSGLLNYTLQACTLTYYDTSSILHDVQFSFANYRQMLVDKGFVQSFISPKQDGYDNNAVFYDDINGKYYMMICNGVRSDENFPLILLESTDFKAWSFSSRIGDGIFNSSEISAVCKNGIIYASFRESTGMNWMVYDVENYTVLGQGKFNVKITFSRPFTFTFQNKVFMAINVDPSVYGSMKNTVSYVDSRGEVNLYLIYDNTPVLMRKIANPTGINYHCWCETPPYTCSGQSAPMTAYSAIYCAFSEDRRLLYRRAFSQVSFGDVTPLFAYYRKFGFNTSDNG